MSKEAQLDRPLLFVGTCQELLRFRDMIEKLVTNALKLDRSKVVVLTYEDFHAWSTDLYEKAILFGASAEWEVSEAKCMIAPGLETIHSSQKSKAKFWKELQQWL